MGKMGISINVFQILIDTSETVGGHIKTKGIGVLKFEF
jgi:hypothetical protein